MLKQFAANNEPLEHLQQNNQSLFPSTRRCNCTTATTDAACRNHPAIAPPATTDTACSVRATIATTATDRNTTAMQEDEQPTAPAVPQLPPQPEQGANPPADNIYLHHIPPMNNSCPHCGAKYFKEEQNTRKKYTKCCREGAVTLPQIQPPPHLHPLQGQQPKYAELYIMDTAEAVEHRANNPTNRDLNKDTIKKLQDKLLAVNPYAQEYKNIGGILQQQQQQATAANKPIPTFDMIITSRADQDHRYHSPAAAEIAAIYSTKDGAAPDPNDRIIHIQRHDGYLIDIKATNPAADPLTYPLLFPFGEHESKSENISQPFTYQDCCFNSRYLVDAFTKVEGSDLTYIRTHQKDLIVESYKGLMDHLYRGPEHQNLLAQAHNPATAQHINIGRVIILPSSFTGSQRSMQQNYQDAMTIVRKHGKPDIFLTFTANPSWQEIVENLLPNQKPQDRPDIVTRIFNLKFKELLCDILDLNFFGKVIAYVYTVEFQERGLPHTHMILSLAEQDKPRTPEHIDRIISAEIPDQNTHNREHHIVKKHMMHGPCGILNLSCICMQDWKCTKKFPKDLAQQTELNVNGYPLYRRLGTPHRYWITSS
eukprot:gene13255-biopygen10574